MGAAVLVVIVVLALTNLANHCWFSRRYLFTCPMVAVLLVSVGRLAGPSWTELGMGRHALLHGVVWAAGEAQGVAWRVVQAVAAGTKEIGAPMHPWLNRVSTAIDQRLALVSRGPITTESGTTTGHTCTTTVSTVLTRRPGIRVRYAIIHRSPIDLRVKVHSFCRGPDFPRDAVLDQR